MWGCTIWLQMSSTVFRDVLGINSWWVEWNRNHGLYWRVVKKIKGQIKCQKLLPSACLKWWYSIMVLLKCITLDFYKHPQQKKTTFEFRVRFTSKIIFRKYYGFKFSSCGVGVIEPLKFCYVFCRISVLNCTHNKQKVCKNL